MAALSALGHLPAEEPAAVDDAPQVDVEDLLPVLGGGVEEGAGQADPGVVDQDVHHAVLGGDLRRRASPSPARRETSTVSAQASGAPTSRDSSAVRAAPSASRSTATTRAPASAKAKAVARPMPLAAPVTSTSCPPNRSAYLPGRARPAAPRAALLVGRDELGDPGGQLVGPGARDPVLGGQGAADQLRGPLLQVVVEPLGQERVPGRRDELHGRVRVRVGARAAQPGPDVVPVEPGAVRRVRGQRGGRVAAGGHLLDALRGCCGHRLPSGPRQASSGSTGVCSMYTYQDLAPWPRSWPTRRGVGRVSRRLIQWPKWSRDGPGHRGEGRDPALGARDRDELPAPAPSPSRGRPGAPAGPG